MSLHYNGEHQSSPFEAISIFLELNHVIGNSQVFGDQNSAATSVLEKAVDVSITDVKIKMYYSNYFL